MIARLPRREAVAALALPALLAVLGLGSLLLYENARFLHRFSQGISAYIFNYLGQFVIYLLACYFVLRLREPRSRYATILIVLVIIAFGAWFRERLVTQPPYLSSDIYRYIWDGRVQAAGINPYRYVPGAPELSHLRDDHIYPYINRRDFAQTIYPPFAQAVFLAGYLASPSSVTGFKLVIISFDGIALIAIILALRRLGLDPARVILFAWHPLIVWEGAHSGHAEPVVTACLALAILARVADKPIGTGIALALATLTKFYPALLLPLFATRLVAPDPLQSRLRMLVKRIDPRTLTAFAVVVVVGYLPYLRAGSLVLGYLPGYFKEEGFVESGSRYFLLALARKLVPIPTAVYAVAAIALLGFVVVRAMLRAERDHKALLRYSAAVIGLFLTLSAPRYSWYLAWLVPFLCFVPSIAWLYLTGASIFLYLLWLTTDYPNVPIWLGASLYLPAWLFYWWEQRRRSGAVPAPADRN